MQKLNIKLKLCMMYMQQLNILCMCTQRNNITFWENVAKCVLGNNPGKVPSVILKTKKKNICSQKTQVIRLNYFVLLLNER